MYGVTIVMKGQQDQGPWYLSNQKNFVDDKTRDTKHEIDFDEDHNKNQFASLQQKTSKHNEDSYTYMDYSERWEYLTKIATESWE